MALTGAAEDFAGRLATRAADDLYTLLTRLWDRKGIARRDLFGKTVEPLFEAFRKIHGDYEQAFKEYRDALREREDSLNPGSPLLDRIRSDLNFGETQRVDLLALLRSVQGTELERFVTAILEYLVSTEEMQDSAGGIEAVLAKPSREMVQRHRNSLIADLESVALDNPWPYVLDPRASAPPLYGEDLERELDERRREHGIQADDPKWEIKLHQALAVQILDRRHRLMIDAYSKVSDEYHRLKRELAD